MNEKDNAKRTKAVDSLINFETVKYYNAELYEIDRYKQAILDYQKCEWKVMASLNLLNFIQSFITNGGLLVGSILAAYMVSQDLKTVGKYCQYVSNKIEKYNKYHVNMKPLCCKDATVQQ